METSTQKAPPTFESVWSILQENALQMQETDRQMKESRADYDRRQQETDRLLQETDRMAKETFRLQQETDRQMRKSEHRLKNMEKTMGSWANNHGSFAEEYFFNSFENGEQNFFGEQFDIIKKNVTSVIKSQNIEDEYDIVMYNSASIAIIEVKYKAHENNIQKLLRKAETFRILYPYYRDFKIYLGLASMSFHPSVEEACIKEGIAVIKQVGDTVMINDEHLKVF